jgi:serpin B
VVLLPQQRGGLKELEKVLTVATLKAGLAKLRSHMGQVALPRFKMSTYYPVAQDLQKMGMRLAFSDTADFSGIGGGLRISSVEHKAYIDVDEVGTEAAAATALAMAVVALPTFVLRADHPFLFLIREKHSGTILFIGRVTDPSHHMSDR